MTVDGKGFENGKIPPNVRTAANFYERWLYPLLYVVPVYYGKNDLKVEDPVETNFLGNMRVEHAGHFRIVKKSHVAGLICNAVRQTYESEPPQTLLLP